MRNQDQGQAEPTLDPELYAPLPSDHPAGVKEVEFDHWRYLMEERPGDHEGDLFDEALGRGEGERPPPPPPGQRLASSDPPERPQMLCRSARVQTRVFFSPAASDIDRAKSVCSRCLLRQRCLDAAKRNPKQQGVWGGQVFPIGNKRPSPAPGHPRVVAGPVPDGEPDLVQLELGIIE